MKTKIIYPILFLLISSFSFSQGFKEKKGKVKALKIAYITEELDLTTEEAQKFWPIYNAFDDKQSELRHEKMRAILDRYEPENIEKLSEKEVKVVSLFYKKQVWISSIAALFLLAIAIPVYFNMAKESNLDSNTIESYLADQQSVGTTELIKHLTDEDISELQNALAIDNNIDAAIENYLSETANLDYLLNE